MTAPADADLMRAAQYDRYDPPAMLRTHSVAIPELRPKHVLRRVAGTSVNAADITIRTGKLRRLTGRRFPRGTRVHFTGQVVDVGAEGCLTSARPPGPCRAAGWAKQVIVANPIPSDTVPRPSTTG
ncbi:hypothetical protein [Mycobacterium sp. MUNTM1]